MAGTVVADTLQADSTSTLVLKNGVANTPPTIQDSAGTQIGTFCRAWVQFNGSTVTNPASMTGVNGSFNVSSVLDNGTGDYTVNFTTAMPDANYNFALSCQGSGASNNLIGIEQNIATNPTTSSIRVLVKQVATSIDRNYVCVAIFR